MRRRLLPSLQGHDSVISEVDCKALHTTISVDISLTDLSVRCPFHVVSQHTRLHDPVLVGDIPLLVQTYAYASYKKEKGQQNLLVTRECGPWISTDCQWY